MSWIVLVVLVVMAVLALGVAWFAIRLARDPVRQQRRLQRRRTRQYLKKNLGYMPRHQTSTTPVRDPIDLDP